MNSGNKLPRDHAGKVQDDDCVEVAPTSKLAPEKGLDKGGRSRTPAGLRSISAYANRAAPPVLKPGLRDNLGHTDHSPEEGVWDSGGIHPNRNASPGHYATPKKGSGDQSISRSRYTKTAECGSDYLSIISAAAVELPTRSLEEERRKHYYLKDSTRYARSVDLDDTNWISTTSSLMACSAEFKRTLAPVVTLFASYFLTHLGLLREEPDLIFKIPPRCALVFTYSPVVINSLKKLYWALNDLYFPCQHSQGGLAEYESAEEMLSNWKEFHLVSLAHLDEEEYGKTIGAVSRQNNQLFVKRWPLIMIADPTQEDWANMRGLYTFTA